MAEMKFCKIGKGTRIHQLRSPHPTDLGSWTICKLGEMNPQVIHTPFIKSLMCKKCIAAAEREQKGKGK